MAIRDEKLDLRGLTMQVDAMEVAGVEIDSTDFADVAGLVADLTATAAELNILDGVTATAAELNITDTTLQTETIAEGGVVSVTKRYTKLTQTTTGSITLAAPDASMLGQVKAIEQVNGGTDAVTLALTNVDGGSAATTASFNATGETLIMVAGPSKWHVVKEIGVTLS